MKPHRLTLTNSLVIGYGLDRRIHHFRSPPSATRQELETWHDPKYIEVLEKKTVDQDSGYILKESHNGTDTSTLERLMKLSEVTDDTVDDCPVFGGMYQFFKQYAGASLAGARSLVTGRTDIAINWSGGLHHAKKSSASGFCYINDIVLAILELLRYSAA